MKREYIDFHLVPDHQVNTHKRLMNWASWCRIKPQAWSQHPLWKQYRSNWRQWHIPEYRETCDILDAMEVEQTVRVLPNGNRDALRWFYVHGGDPSGFAKKLGVSKTTLEKLITDGRTMVANKT